jgi:acetyl esterase
MPVHPQIAKALEALAKADIPAIESLSPEDAREQMAAMSKARGGEPLPIEKSEDRTIPGPAGDIPVRIYWPLGGKPKGAVVYYHGGGHVIGSLETHDRVARNLTHYSGALILSVDYRMGPEDPFPAAVDDSWAALEWMAEAAPEFGVDPADLAVAGDSAGANLAAVVAIMARDAGTPKLKFQALIYPVADYTLSSDSYRRYGVGYGILTADAMKWFQKHYLKSAADAEDWRASPIKAESLTGLARAFVITAECDVLHDEGAAYAEALQAAGVPCIHSNYGGMIHAFFGMAPDVDDAVTAQQETGAAIARAFA